MFHYEYEKRPPSSLSCESRATATTDWSRRYPSAARTSPSAARTSPNAARTSPTVRGSEKAYSVERARRPLPPRPVCELHTMPTKNSVPLKVWVIASASCFAVCAVLVLATVVVTKWGTTDHFTTHEVYAPPPEPVYSNPIPNEIQQETSTEKKIAAKEEKTTAKEEKTTAREEEETSNDIQYPVLEKLSIFKNVVANRDKKRTNTDKKQDQGLLNKPQMHPIHDEHLTHAERRIEKKDKPKYPEHFDFNVATTKKGIPDFKPTLPDVFINKISEVKLPDGFVAGLRKYDTELYEEYYNDENLYDDYMQSNSMTSYLIEKVQELHDWITTDPDFVAVNNATNKLGKTNVSANFGQLLKALNETLVEGNVTIVMNKLKDIYFGDNHTATNHSRKVILSNSTDLLSFGILTLDVMLLHNIQLMAWESQEVARNKMLKDPDVFAFNALFLEPSKVESKQNEILHHYENTPYSKRQNLRQETVDDFDIGKNLLENILDIGMSTARAAIHLGRAYKNTRLVVNQISNRDQQANAKNQISRNIEFNSHALNHLQTFSDKPTNTTFYTELDCVWLLYCKNLAATAKLNAPYGTMARINGMALRMLTGELSADRALDTMLYEALTGWTDLNCTDIFPRCSKVDAASIVMDSILQPVRKTNRSS